MKSPKKIFVQMPSYRDKQLIPTLVDLIENATAPNELRIVVCWQHAEDEALDGFTQGGFALQKSDTRNEQVVHYFTYGLAHVEVIDIHFLKTKGCGWARSTAQRHFEGEKYSLQIDAHHRFIKGWDSALINMIESLRSNHRKPLLTGYPPGFDPGTYPKKRQNLVFQMAAKSFTDGVVKFKPVPMINFERRRTPMRARFISGGFIFADGSFVNEVMNDEEHFFTSEEIAMAVRAYTHGYDFFHPHRIVLWHQYHSEARKVWEDHTAERKERGEIEATALDRAKNGSKRFLDLLGADHQQASEITLGQFGIGSVRTIKQYERFAGLSFSHKGFRREALIASEPEGFNVEKDEPDWEESLICTRVIRLRIHNNAQEVSIAESEGVTLIAYDTQEAQIAQQDFPIAAFKKSLCGRFFEYTFAIEASPSKLPARYELVVGDDTFTDRCEEFSEAYEIYEPGQRDLGSS